MKSFYKDQSITALTGTAVAFDWNFESELTVISNDDTSGSNIIVVGVGNADEIALKLRAGESIVFDHSFDLGLWLKYETGAPSYRLMVVGR